MVRLLRFFRMAKSLAWEIWRTRAIAGSVLFASSPGFDLLASLAACRAVKTACVRALHLADVISAGLVLAKSVPSFGLALN